MRWFHLHICRLPNNCAPAAPAARALVHWEVNSLLMIISAIRGGNQTNLHNQVSIKLITFFHTLCSAGFGNGSSRHTLLVQNDIYVSEHRHEHISNPLKLTVKKKKKRLDATCLSNVGEAVRLAWCWSLTGFWWGSGEVYIPWYWKHQCQHVTWNITLQTHWRTGAE